MTLDEGLMRTCLFPAFSALLIALRQSLRTDVLTIFAVLRKGLSGAATTVSFREPF